MPSAGSAPAGAGQLTGARCPTLRHRRVCPRRHPRTPRLATVQRIVTPSRLNTSSPFPPLITSSPPRPQMTSAWSLPRRNVGTIGPGDRASHLTCDLQDDRGRGVCRRSRSCRTRPPVASTPSRPHPLSSRGPPARQPRGAATLTGADRCHNNPSAPSVGALPSLAHERFEMRPLVTGCGLGARIIECAVPPAAERSRRAWCSTAVDSALSSHA